MGRASVRDADSAAMMAALGVGSVDELFRTIPPELRLAGRMDLPGPLSDLEVEDRCRRLAATNLDGLTAPCFAGGGVYDHFVPATVSHLVARGEFTTAYTAYQPELSQGMLAALFEFQTMLCELTGMDVANSSLYDGGTALAEAVLVAAGSTRRSRVVVAGAVNPRYLECVRTLAGVTVDLVTVPAVDGHADLAAVALDAGNDCAAIVVQQPNYFGCLEPMQEVSALAHAAGALLIVSFDPVSLGLLGPPGHYGADVAVGEGGMMCGPMSLGGPGLGLFTCTRDLVRRMPGRVVGETVDTLGRRSYVNTLQTREQHIRREKATSNICTNQALCAVAAGIYLATMGPRGIRAVADLCLQKAHYAARAIAALPGFSMAFPEGPFLKEFVVRCPVPVGEIKARLAETGPFIGGVDVSSLLGDGHYMSVAVTEKRTRDEIDGFVRALGGVSRA